MIEILSPVLSDEKANVVDRLNAAGLESIVGSNVNITADGLVPLVQANPIGERSDHPLSEFENGVLLRAYGLYNGQHHHPSQFIWNTALATLLDMPVIGIGFPNGGWSGYAGIDRTVGWNDMSVDEQHTAGIKQYDSYARVAMQGVAKHIIENDGVGSFYVAGESGGATLALSLAHQEADLDAKAAVIAALANVEGQTRSGEGDRRHLYVKGLLREGLLIDFNNSTASLADDASGSFPQMRPLMEVLAPSGVSSIQALKNDARFAAKDMFGVYPRTPGLFYANRSFARPLTLPTAEEMIARLTIPVDHIGFTRDRVSKPEFAEKIELPNFYHTTIEGDHGKCNDPSVIFQAYDKIAL